MTHRFVNSETIALALVNKIGAWIDEVEGREPTASEAKALRRVLEVKSRLNQGEQNDKNNKNISSFNARDLVQRLRIVGR